MFTFNILFFSWLVCSCRSGGFDTESNAVFPCCVLYKHVEGEGNLAMRQWFGATNSHCAGFRLMASFALLPRSRSLRRASCIEALHSLLNYPIRSIYLLEGNTTQSFNPKYIVKSTGRVHWVWKCYTHLFGSPCWVPNPTPASENVYIVLAGMDVFPINGFSSKFLPMAEMRWGG